MFSSTLPLPCQPPASGPASSSPSRVHPTFLTFGSALPARPVSAPSLPPTHRPLPALSTFLQPRPRPAWSPCTSFPEFLLPTPPGSSFSLFLTTPFLPSYLHMQLPRCLQNADAFGHGSWSKWGGLRVLPPGPLWTKPARCTRPCSLQALGEGGWAGYPCPPGLSGECLGCKPRPWKLELVAPSFWVRLLIAQGGRRGRAGGE